MDPYTLFSKMIESFWEQLFRLDNELVGLHASEKGKQLSKFQF